MHGFIIPNTQNDIDLAPYELFTQGDAHIKLLNNLLKSRQISAHQRVYVDNMGAIHQPIGFINNNYPSIDQFEDDDSIVVIPLRDVPFDDAKREINDYINQLQQEGVAELSIGEVARTLELDLDIVIEVFEERDL
jgi:hypothetical protein